MKFNKQIVIILVLVSLLLSALGAAYYFYYLNQNSLVKNNQLKVVYVASKNIKKNTKIQKSHLKKVTIAKKFILTTPLIAKEIIGKYVKENFYKNDMFRKEKIRGKFDEDNTSVVEKFKYNSYNISFKMFKNPNYSIKKGDIIDIISVYPAVETKFTKSPNAVQYVASQIKVLGFLSDGKESAKSINKKTIIKTVKKKKVKQVINKKADDMLIDIKGKVLLSLIDDYNRGNQLWIVKTHLIKEEVKIVEEEVEETVVSKINTQKSNRVYKPRLYTPKETFKNVKATIYYGDDKQATVMKNKTIKIDLDCKDSDNYLIAMVNNVHLRSGASYKYRIKRTVFKNYIIPYKSMANPNWFITCDGYYISKNEVKVISKEVALKKLVK